MPREPGRKQQQRGPRAPTCLPKPRGLLGALAVLAFAATAHADCGSCPAPTAAQLAAQPGFALKTRQAPPPFNQSRRDFVEVDGGECRASLDGAITIEKTNAWLALRATGEVWNCPHSVSDDTVVIEVRNGDSTSWTVNGSVSAEVATGIAKIKAQIAAGQTQGESVIEVTRVSKTIRAKVCNRIPWKGYFEIATYVARAPMRIERRWAWWTKNATTGATVHAKGSIWVPCGTEEVVLDRQAPISGLFRLARASCNDPECESFPTEDLGWFPRLDDEDDAPATPITPRSSDDAGASETPLDGDAGDVRTDEGHAEESPPGASDEAQPGAEPEPAPEQDAAPASGDEPDVIYDGTTS